MPTLRTLFSLFLFTFLSVGAVGPSLAATIEDMQTTNISALITKINGLPKSVRIDSVAADGNVVVGTFYAPASSGSKLQSGRKVFLYTPATEIEELEEISQRSITQIGVSNDGTIIWGTFYDNSKGTYAGIFRWTRERGIQELGNFAKRGLVTHGVSADGSYVVGSFLQSSYSDKKNVHHAFRYSQSGGFEDLGSMGSESAHAHGVSADGSRIVGIFDITKAFQYSQSDGVNAIGKVNGNVAWATGISNDGTVVVGHYFGRPPSYFRVTTMHPFVYSKEHGVQTLGFWGERSVGAPSISYDGTRVSGSYIDSDFESYVYTGVIKFEVKSYSPFGF